MARSRLPSKLGWLQLIIRTLSMLLTLATLTLALYLSTTYSLTNPILYVAIVWTLMLDDAEIIALISKHTDGVHRANLCPLITLEVLGIVFYLISFFITRLDLNSAVVKPNENDTGQETGNSTGTGIGVGDSWTGKRSTNVQADKEWWEEYERLLAYEAIVWLMVMIAMGMHVINTTICAYDTWYMDRPARRERRARRRHERSLGQRPHRGEGYLYTSRNPVWSPIDEFFDGPDPRRPRRPRR